jgi:diguanylate cyclase (GGDEF)-like protein
VLKAEHLHDTVETESEVRPGLSEALGAWLGWFSALSRAAFFPHEVIQPLPRLPDILFALSAPEALADQPALRRLAAAQQELEAEAQGLLVAARGGHPPSAAAWSGLCGRYEALVTGLQRIERAFSLAQSNIDALTGLRSRLGMREDLEREFERFRRSGSGFCLAICDIDHFKRINDTHGHAVGDEALVSIAGAISRNIRSFDEAYRLGGEEFLICLKEAGLGEGRKVLERLRKYIASHPLVLPKGGVEVPMTASFGLVQAHPRQSLDALIDEADRALYRAKRQGRNRVSVIDPLEKSGELRVSVPPAGN